jgi:prepilin-type N-terminal cleavage/methylation domain-containing protein
MMTRRRWLLNQQGFTLAELLVVAAVMGLLMAGVFALQRQGQEAYLLGSSRVETQQNARVALDLMTRELRSASPCLDNGLPDCNPDPTAPTGIVSIPSATNITFRDQCRKNVQYSLAGTLLNRTGPNYSDRSNCVSNGNDTTPIIGGVTSLSMRYYTATSATTTDPTKVAVIKISVNTKTEKGVATCMTGSPRDQCATMESTIKLRATLS